MELTFPRDEVLCESLDLLRSKVYRDRQFIFMIYIFLELVIYYIIRLRKMFHEPWFMYSTVYT